MPPSLNVIWRRFCYKEIPPQLPKVAADMGHYSSSTRKPTVLLRAQTTGGGSFCNFEIFKPLLENKNPRLAAGGFYFPVSALSSPIFQFIYACAEKYGHRGGLKSRVGEVSDGSTDTCRQSRVPLLNQSDTYGEKSHLSNGRADATGTRFNPYHVSVVCRAALDS